MKMTAVDYMIEELLKGTHFMEVCVMAKSLEREQLEKAMMHALDEDGHTGDWKNKFIKDYISKL